MDVDKRDVYADGVWCIKDMNTSVYKHHKMHSQMQVAWTDQPRYAKYMIYFGVVVVACFVAKRILFLSIDRYDRQHHPGPRSGVVAMTLQNIVAVNRYISYRQIPHSLCNYFGLPASIGNTLIVLATLLYVLCFTFIPKFWYRACRGFGSAPLAVRAGLEAVALIPFIIILSGKCNLISSFTGISYEKINVYHRWLSMICYILTWVHIIPFYYQAMREGGAERVAYFQRTETLFVNGIPPTVFLTWLCCASYTSIRQWWYELFVHMHWLCGVGFCISLYIHVYPELGSQDYLYATLALWVSQLLWRAFTKTACAPNRSFLKTRKAQAIKQLISDGIFDRESGCFVLKIANPNADFKWHPGQHLFIRLPGLRILDNHPFSICNLYSNGADIKLIIRPRSGLTKQMYKEIPDHVNKLMKMYIDGPYGGTDRDIDAFTNVYLMATGTGISAVLPYLLFCAASIDKKNTNVTTVKLDWIVKYKEDIKWINEELRQIPENLITEGILQVNVYICRNSITSLSSENISLHEPFKSDIHSEKVTNGDLQYVSQVFRYKPNVKDLMQDVCKTLGPKNMIICSGSNSFKSAVGNGVASSQTYVFCQENDVKEVYLHTESFDW